MKHSVCFLDRDGVINRERGDYVYRVEDFELNEGILEAASILAPTHYLVVITNQGGIAKSIYTHDDVAVVHQYMQDLLTANATPLDAVYYCPHHEEYGRCLCRKPSSLMIEKALARFDLNPSSCVMIGDSRRDVEAAQGVGVGAYQIPSNSSIVSLAQNIANGALD